MKQWCKQQIHCGPQGTLKEMIMFDLQVMAASQVIGHDTLVAIIETNKVVSYHFLKSLQLIYRSL